LLNLAVVLTMIIVTGIGLVVWHSWAARALGLGATASFGLLYWQVAHTAQSQRRLYLYFALQTMLTLGLLALSYPSDPHYILLIILAIEAMLVLPLWPALVSVAVFHIAGFVGPFLRIGAEAILENVFNVAAFALTGAFGYTLRQAELARRRNEQLVEELRAAQHQLKDLAVDEERNRLARELHDSVKQQVFAIGMQLGAARASLDEQAEAYAHVAEAERLARLAGQELSALIRELRPPALEHRTLAATLQAHVEDWSRQSHIPASVRVTGEAALSPAGEAALLRVSQEALANVARHSQATAVEVSLAYAGAPNDGAGRPSATLTVADNGRGFELPGVARGVGLDSMRERMEALGGRLTVESTPGAGTRVVAQIEAKDD
jgi:signal transduction histidine kinase